jgi:hypothetical protein
MLLASIVAQHRPPDFLPPWSSPTRRLRSLRLTCGSDAETTAGWQVHGQTSRRNMRGTSPQWILTAGSVATLEPIIIVRAFPFLQTKGYGFVGRSSDALGYPASTELYYWLAANRIKETFRTPSIVARTLLALSISSNISIAAMVALWGSAALAS